MSVNTDVISSELLENLSTTENLSTAENHFGYPTDVLDNSEHTNLIEINNMSNTEYSFEEQKNEVEASTLTSNNISDLLSGSLLQEAKIEALQQDSGISSEQSSTSVQQTLPKNNFVLSGFLSDDEDSDASEDQNSFKKTKKESLTVEEVGIDNHKSTLITSLPKLQKSYGIDYINDSIPSNANVSNFNYPQTLLEQPSFTSIGQNSDAQDLPYTANLAYQNYIKAQSLLGKDISTLSKASIDIDLNPSLVTELNDQIAPVLPKPKKITKNVIENLHKESERLIRSSKVTIESKYEKKSFSAFAQKLKSKKNNISNTPDSTNCNTEYQQVQTQSDKLISLDLTQPTTTDHNNDPIIPIKFAYSENNTLVEVEILDDSALPTNKFSQFKNTQKKINDINSNCNIKPITPQEKLKTLLDSQSKSIFISKDEPLNTSQNRGPKSLLNLSNTLWEVILTQNDEPIESDHSTQPTSIDLPLPPKITVCDENLDTISDSFHNDSSSTYSKPITQYGASNSDIQVSAKETFNIHLLKENDYSSSNFESQIKVLGTGENIPNLLNHNSNDNSNLKLAKQLDPTASYCSDSESDLDVFSNSLVKKANDSYIDSFNRSGDLISLSNDEMLVSSKSNFETYKLEDGGDDELDTTQPLKNVYKSNLLDLQLSNKSSNSQNEFSSFLSDFDKDTSITQPESFGILSSDIYNDLINESSFIDQETQNNFENTQPTQVLNSLSNESDNDNVELNRYPSLIKEHLLNDFDKSSNPKTSRRRIFRRSELKSQSMNQKFEKQSKSKLSKSNNMVEAEAELGSDDEENSENINMANQRFKHLDWKKQSTQDEVIEDDEADLYYEEMDSSDEEKLLEIDPLLNNSIESEGEDENIIKEHLKHNIDEDSKVVNNIIRDLTTGRLGRRKNAGNGYLLDDDEDYNDRQTRTERMLARRGIRKKLESQEIKDTNLAKIAKNPATTAFAEAALFRKSESVKFELDQVLEDWSIPIITGENLNNFKSSPLTSPVKNRKTGAKYNDSVKDNNNKKDNIEDILFDSSDEEISDDGNLVLEKDRINDAVNLGAEFELDSNEYSNAGFGLSHSSLTGLLPDKEVSVRVRNLLNKRKNTEQTDLYSLKVSNKRPILDV
ncbi:hypothetical protein BB561_005010 [Smittium simulii]|uniref:DNA replication checkpoint mediator MRC1 domain-containing protein n=1 Tax=Smittium simulii TaxID=133385 RepID=A0A2T9YCR3_9FUNG|nr:hypothetical protein BB561_005010 [Smittium simulii]